MNRQVFILITGGLFAALIVALIVQMMIGEEETVQTANAPAIQTTEILVASQNINIGDELSENSIEWQEWPKNALFPGAIVRSSLEDPDAPLPIEGQLKRSLAEGEPITRAALLDENSGNFVASSLRDGMRAMAVTVDAQSSVGGFITPGDYVDVILTHSVRLPSDDNIQDASRTVISQMTAQTILENIRVVAVDQDAMEREEIKLFKTVTLEVTPKQAEELALGKSMGDLSLSLRRIGDTATTAGQAGTKSEATTDVRMSKVMQELVGEENTSGVTSRIVRIYNGSEVEDMAVRPYSAQ